MSKEIMVAHQQLLQLQFWKFWKHLRDPTYMYCANGMFKLYVSLTETLNDYENSYEHFAVSKRTENFLYT